MATKKTIKLSKKTPAKKAPAKAPVKATKKAPAKAQAKPSKAPAKATKKAPAKAVKASKKAPEARSGDLDLRRIPDPAVKIRNPASMFSHGDVLSCQWEKAWRKKGARGLETWTGVKIPPSHTHVLPSLTDPDVYEPAFIVPPGHSRIFFLADPDGAPCAMHWADIEESALTLVRTRAEERARVREANKPSPAPEAKKATGKASKKAPSKLPEKKAATKAASNIKALKTPLKKASKKAPSKATKSPAKGKKAITA